MDPQFLREQTRAEHEATEALMPLTGAQLTKETYVRTLEILYPLIACWEQWAAAAAPESLRGLLTARKRSHLLAIDLQILHGDRHAFSGEVMDWKAIVGEQDEGEAEPSARAAFLGAMYVMEGSTLGGRYIARHVESTLGLIPGRGNAYFQGHGEATGVLWREITAQVRATPDAFAPVLVGVARKTFSAFGQALSAGNVQNMLSR